MAGAAGLSKAGSPSVKVRFAGKGEEGENAGNDADHGEQDAAHQKKAERVRRVGFEDERDGVVQRGKGKEDAHAKGNPGAEHGDGVNHVEQVEWAERIAGDDEALGKAVTVVKSFGEQLDAARDQEGHDQTGAELDGAVMDGDVLRNRFRALVRKVRTR